MSDDEPEILILCDLIHAAWEASGFECPERGDDILCWDLAEALLAAGVRVPKRVTRDD